MKNTDTTLIYDNSFSGFLSAVYFAFKERLSISEIRRAETGQNLLFSDMINVKTNQTAARSLWQAMQKKNYEAAKTIYFAYMSESQSIETSLYKYIRSIISNRTDSTNDLDLASLKKIKLMAGLVSREKKRMEGLVCLEQTYPDLQLAYIEPDFNVLPLITKYFKSSQSNCPWIIYDRKRKYGIYFDGRMKHIVSFDLLKIILVQKHLAEPASLPINLDTTGPSTEHSRGQSGRQKTYYHKTGNAA